MPSREAQRGGKVRLLSDATLNSSNFAGHTDWRLPNINELLSLVHYGVASPAVHGPFNRSCTATCAVTSCKVHPMNAGYWSSTTHQIDSSSGWYVNFNIGLASTNPKTFFGYVRAVRGGS